MFPFYNIIFTEKENRIKWRKLCNKITNINKQIHFLLLFQINLFVATEKMNFFTFSGFSHKLRGRILVAE